MERILVINGPNLNLLGERDSSQYGSKTLEEVNREIAALAEDLGVEVVFYQSNHEGDLIDRIHAERKKASGIIANPGALAHYSYALRDAFEAAGLPVVEVHISDISARESWRAHSVTGEVAWKVIIGRGTSGYGEALRGLTGFLRKVR
ncbi:MAG: type II 3-dehydroquinate dehydratase [Actinobacteria bacterium]|nr:type II 3-dehydroquinate dehydratase [Actinomycetota bacterium]MCG2819948.1 type II 3-dehydroquinate dehydratase [Actinomycetes bacterium]MBU4218929.1 type II 3-dehydroquinate dehydratase [Actinomycetota bacterium]MBU4359800.1 type II 3-dehydroquinate dehydratase [Actinomycetota bacterium]MBU4390996.1 type II 3-dehydroquinate dehydratase [Actinomycetota bacterium]